MLSAGLCVVQLHEQKSMFDKVFQNFVLKSKRCPAVEEASSIIPTDKTFALTRRNLLSFIWLLSECALVQLIVFQPLQICCDYYGMITADENHNFQNFN